MELLNIDQSYLVVVYAIGVCLSLVLRLIVMSSCSFINKNTRLKEIKNLTNKAMTDCLRNSYMSLLWPYEIISSIVLSVKHVFSK